MEPKDLIYGVGILFTFGLGAWNLLVNYKTTRKTSFINTVTSRRIKWIEQLRQDIAAYCGLTVPQLKQIPNQVFRRSANSFSSFA